LSDIGFAPKKIIPQEVCQLEILAADKVVSGEHDGHTFTDYASRDEDTGQINEGSKAWSVFESCLGRDFYKQPSVSLDSLVGKRFVARVSQTRTGSRNKLEFGTVGPVPLERNGASVPDGDDAGNGVDFSGISS
jgi:hypothetical protein